MSEWSAEQQNQLQSLIDDLDEEPLTRMADRVNLQRLVTAALAALAASQERVRAVEGEWDRARAWAKRWKRTAKHEQQRRKSSERLWLKAALKHVQTDLELRKTRVAVTLMGRINDAEARDWDAIIAERTALEAERDAALARAEAAEAVLRFYAEPENYWTEYRTNDDIADDKGQKARAYLEAHGAPESAGTPNHTTPEG